MRLTRRQLLAGGAGALTAAGIYGLVERFTGAPERGSAGRLREDQHVLEGVEVVVDDGVEVVVPPLHHQVITGTVQVEGSAGALREAQQAFEDAFRALERRFEPTPRGLGTTVAWGLPYFRRYVPALADRHLPVDLRASKAAGRRVLALLDAMRFPSDPEETILEENDVAILLRSDSLEQVGAGAETLLRELDGLLKPTSVRKGFAGGGFAGAQSLPKRMALAAGIPGAELIPDTAELFLGFTSTQKDGLGPARIANYDTLPGYTDQWPDGYCRNGTAMHLSHLFEDLEAWYLNFDFRERVDTTFRPGQPVSPGTQTVRQAAEDAAGTQRLLDDADRFGAVGHSATIQPTSRLQEDVMGNDGTLYPRGTAVPQRADFNTLDNPFFWSARADLDGQKDEPAAGVHFVVFNPTSDDFHRNRLAMDGVMPDGTKLPFVPRARGQGINSVLTTTHRQNFLVPPRRHRSFPLAEFLS